MKYPDAFLRIIVKKNVPEGTQSDTDRKTWNRSFIDREAFGVARKQINNTPHRIVYIEKIYAYTR